MVDDVTETPRCTECDCGEGGVYCNWIAFPPSAYIAELYHLKAEQHALRDLLVEAATDLTAYVSNEYPPKWCEQFPDVARRHHRDMELVRRIDAAISERNSS